MIADRYYYSILNESEKRIYQQLYKGVLNLDREVLLPRVHMSLDALEKVFHALTSDNPVLYYLNQTVMDAEQSLAGTVIKPQYFCSRDQIAEYNRRLEHCVNQIMTELHLEEASEAQRVRSIHDYLCQNVSYDKEAVNSTAFNKLVAAHSIIGVFAKQKAVCEGIAKATKLLMNTADIKCMIVDGTGDLENGPHTWNIVKIEGLNYQMDVTWDLSCSGEGKICYDYFNLTDEDISRDHYDFCDVPTCHSVSENYFIKNGLEFHSRRKLNNYILTGLTRNKTDFYFRYRGPEPIKDLMPGLVSMLQDRLSQGGIPMVIYSSVQRSQGIGRITLEVHV